MYVGLCLIYCTQGTSTVRLPEQGMYRMYLLSLLSAVHTAQDGPAGAGFLYDKAGELGEKKERFCVYIRNAFFSKFAVCSVSCSSFSLFSFVTYCCRALYRT